MSQVVLGNSGSQQIRIDLPTLMRSRMLIEGNSGCGKSETLQLLAEQLDGKVQTIIIDLEDEFAILRKKHNYILVGKGGDTPADCRSASMLAHKLLELRASAVCNLYEMKAADRHRWVRLFLEALIDAPKHLWHPVVIIIDEIHVFCPEKGSGESEASDAVIDLATRGRKRGFCLIGATQRLGKFRKDAAAELLNIMVGMTFIDVDRRRAAEALGIPKSEERKFFDEIKVMDSGTFWVLGRAISKDRVLVKVNRIGTPRIAAGGKIVNTDPPPPPEKVRALLPKLADLPRAAEEKAVTEATLKADLRSVKAQLAAALRASSLKAAAPPSPPKPATISVPVISESLVKRLEKLSGAVESSIKHWSDAAGELAAKIKKAGDWAFKPTWRMLPVTFSPREKAKPRPLMGGPLKSEFPAPSREVPGAAAKVVFDGNVPMDKAQRKILSVLSWNPDGCLIGKLALLSGYRISGGFKNALSALRSSGYIEGANGAVMKITEDGEAMVGDEADRPPAGEGLVSYWLSHRSFGSCERKILKALMEAKEGGLTIGEIASATGYAVSGGFKNSLSTLRTAGVITGRNTESMKLCEDLLAAV